MADSGCTTHQIATFVENEFQEQQEKLLAFRARKRANQRRYRAKKSMKSTNVLPVTVVTEQNVFEFNGHVTGYNGNKEKAEQNQQPCNVTALSLSSSYLKEGKSAGTVPLPEDWEPKLAHFQKGKELGFSADQVNDAAEDMRLWAASSNTRRTLRGWDATLHQFLRRDAKEKSKSTAKHHSSKLASII
jgi:hypothetical protein